MDAEGVDRMIKKLLLEPIMCQSKISGVEYMEKVLIRDDGYPEAVVHADFFDGFSGLEALRTGIPIIAYIQISEYPIRDGE
jgi:hypothetical protein